MANALSPAQVVSVRISDDDNTASVTVPDRQLSLAIGKEGQNARLAAKLTGWRIDIRSQSAADQEHAPEAAEPVLTGIIAEPEPVGAEELRHQPARIQPAVEEEFPAEPAAAETAVEQPAAEATAAPAAAAPRPAAPAGPRLRFAEDIGLPPLQGPATPERAGSRGAPAKRGGRKTEDEEAELAAAAARAKRTRRGARPVVEDEEEEDEYAYLTRHR